MNTDRDKGKRHSRICRGTYLNEDGGGHLMRIGSTRWIVKDQNKEYSK